MSLDRAQHSWRRARQSVRCARRRRFVATQQGAATTAMANETSGLSARGVAAAAALWWVKLGITPERIEPGHPEQNGQHERMHRTLPVWTAGSVPSPLPFRSRRRATGASADCSRNRRMWGGHRGAEINPAVVAHMEGSGCPCGASPLARRSLDGEQAALDEFRRHFNDERPHEALGQQTPASRYVPSPRRMPDKVPDPEYPAEFDVRRLKGNECLWWHGAEVSVGAVVSREAVGLEPVADGRWQLWFGPIYLGLVIEEAKNKIIFSRNERI